MLIFWPSGDQDFADFQPGINGLSVLSVGTNLLDSLIIPFTSIRLSCYRRHVSLEFGHSKVGPFRGT